MSEGKGSIGSSGILPLHYEGPQFFRAWLSGGQGKIFPSTQDLQNTATPGPDSIERRKTVAMVRGQKKRQKFAIIPRQKTPPAHKWVGQTPIRAGHA